MFRDRYVFKFRRYHVLGIFVTINKWVLEWEDSGFKPQLYIYWLYDLGWRSLHILRFLITCDMEMETFAATLHCRSQCVVATWWMRSTHSQPLVPASQQLTLWLDTQFDVWVAEATPAVLRASQRSSRYWGSPLSLKPWDLRLIIRLLRTGAPYSGPASHMGVSGLQCGSYTPGYYCPTHGMLHS